MTKEDFIKHSEITIPNIKNEINEHSTPETIKVFRAEQRQRAKDISANAEEWMKTGQTIDYSNFMSTSINKKFAQNWSDNKTIFEIAVNNRKGVEQMNIYRAKYKPQCLSTYIDPVAIKLIEDGNFVYLTLVKYDKKLKYRVLNTNKRVSEFDLYDIELVTESIEHELEIQNRRNRNEAMEACRNIPFSQCYKKV